MILLVEMTEVKSDAISPDRMMIAKPDGELDTPASRDLHVPTHHTETLGVTMETKRDKLERWDGRRGKVGSIRTGRGKGKKIQEASYLRLDL